MNTNSIGFALLLNDLLKGFYLLISTHIIICLLRSYKEKKIIIDIPLWIVIIICLMPSRTSMNVMLDEAISSRNGTDLSDSSWKNINKLSTKTVFKFNKESESVKD